MHGRTNRGNGEGGRDLEAGPFRYLRDENQVPGGGHGAGETLQALVLPSAIRDAVQYDPRSVITRAIVAAVDRGRQRLVATRERRIGNVDNVGSRTEVLSQEAQRCTMHGCKCMLMG